MHVSSTLIIAIAQYLLMKAGPIISRHTLHNRNFSRKEVEHHMQQRHFHNNQQFSIIQRKLF